VRIPLARLLDRHGDLDASAPTVVYCAAGYRSSIAASLLRSVGFTHVADLQGGYHAGPTPASPRSHPRRPRDDTDHPIVVRVRRA
jgi:rhodanese-related sulfurtransferase